MGNNSANRANLMPNYQEDHSGRVVPMLCHRPQAFRLSSVFKIAHVIIKCSLASVGSRNSCDGVDPNNSVVFH